MVTRRGFLALLGSAGAATLGLAAGATLLPDDGAADDGYPVMQYGEQTCDRCGMVIDDARFAAAWTGGHQGTMRFDDIGCMVLQAAERSPGTDARFLVHDYETEAWLDAGAATYVISPAIRTPMSYGVAAVASEVAADRIARKVDARVSSWTHLGHQLEAAKAS